MDAVRLTAATRPATYRPTQADYLGRLKVKRPVRFLIYIALLGFAWFMLAPALSINAAQIGAPVKSLAVIKSALAGMNTLAVAAVVFAVALAITYMITSGIGLLLLGALALMGLVVVSILHPYLFPLLIPLFSLWMLCANARRKEHTSAAKVSHAKHAAQHGH